MSLILGFNNHLVKPQEVNDTDNFLLMPDTLKEKPNRGTIVESGLGYNSLPLIFKKGDVITFPKSAGIPIKINGDEDFLIINEEDILIADRNEDSQ